MITINTDTIARALRLAGACAGRHDPAAAVLIEDGNRRPDGYHPHELQYPVESGEQQTAPEMWLDLGPYGAGWVCGEPDPDRPDGVCGMPVEDEPCPIHHPA